MSIMPARLQQGVFSAQVFVARDIIPYNNVEDYIRSIIYPRYLQTKFEPARNIFCAILFWRFSSAKATSNLSRCQKILFVLVSHKRKLQPTTPIFRR